MTNWHQGRANRGGERMIRGVGRWRGVGKRLRRNEALGELGEGGLVTLPQLRW